MSWHDLRGPEHTYSAITRNSAGGLELLALARDGNLYRCRQLEPGNSSAWSEWHSLGKGGWNEAPPRSFVVGMSRNGCLEVFAIADGTPRYGHSQIFHNRQTNPDNAEGEWTGWHSLDAKETNGWSADVGPALVRHADGLLDLFVMSADRGVRQNYWWSDYTSSTAIGRYRQTEDGKWDGPELRVSIETCIDEGSTGDSCTSKLPVKLVPALNSTGRLELFANVGNIEAKRRGAPGLIHLPTTLWHAWQAPTPVRNWWSGSLPMPPMGSERPDAEMGYGNQAAQPMVAMDHDGSLEVYMWSISDHDIWVTKQHATTEGGWSPWSSIGNSKEWKHPVVVGDGSDVLTVFASSMTSDTVWYRAQYLDSHDETTWLDDWQPVGDDGDTSGASLLHAATNQDGRIELFASGPGNLGFRHKYQVAPGEWF